MVETMSDGEYLFGDVSDFFDGLKSSGVNLAWAYTHMSEILADLKLPIFLSNGTVFEDVDLIILKKRLVKENRDKAEFVSETLRRCLSSKKYPTSKQIYDYLNNIHDDYDKIGNHKVIFDEEYRSCGAPSRFILPSSLVHVVRSDNWKNCALEHHFLPQSASVFIAENRLRRLHDCTSVGINFTNFQIGKSRLNDLIREMTNRFNAIALASDLPSAAAIENANVAKSKKILSTGVKHDWIGAVSHFAAKERSRLLYGDGKSYIKDPSGERAQASVIKIMEEWFAESGSTPAKNQLQRYAKDILAAIQLNSVNSKKSI
jgi:hypothetical protein